MSESPPVGNQKADSSRAAGVHEAGKDVSALRWDVYMGRGDVYPGCGDVYEGGGDVYEGGGDV